MALLKRNTTAPDGNPAKAEPGQGGSSPMPVSAPKRRTGALALALALAVIGGLLMWFFQQSSAAQAYITVNRAVDRGAVIQRDMLTTVDVVGEPSQLIRAEDASQVIGKVATMDLSEGSTLTTTNTAAGLGVDQGRTVAGLSLQAGRLPSRTLKAGDQVQVIYTPSADLAAPGARMPDPIPATVEGTSTDETSGNRIVDLNLAEADAATVASWSAKDAVSVVLGANAAPAAEFAPAEDPAKPAELSAPASPSPSASEGENR